MFIGMDPPKHDRIKALFQRGFTPKRIADHEERIRAIIGDVLDRLRDASSCDLVADVAQPVVSRVIGSFMGMLRGGRRDVGADHELGARRPTTRTSAPEGIEGVLEKDIPEMFERCREMIAERRENPTDDLMSVLVHAEVDGEKLEETRDRDGLLPADGGRQRLDQGDLLQRDAGADGGPRAEARAAGGPLADPGRGRGGAADVPRLRPLPPHRDARHRAARASRSRRARRW